MSNRTTRYGPARGGGSDTFLIIGLVAIIIAAVAIGVYQFTGGGPGSSESEGTHFWCLEAGEEVVLSSSELSPADAERVFDIEGASARITNPRTGRNTLVLMRRCRRCKEHFLPEALKRPDAGAAGVRDRSAGNVCSECGKAGNQ